MNIFARSIREAAKLFGEPANSKVSPANIPAPLDTGSYMKSLKVGEEDLYRVHNCRSKTK